MSRFPKKLAITRKRSDTDPGKLNQVIAAAKRHQEQRETTYRERALKLFPLICARCGQQFSGKDLKGLTVHHKDHNHDNNPPDGNNWELLCTYCHDKEHARYLEDQGINDSDDATELETLPINTPFEGLASLFKDKE
jgi:5-methylcytosine-specific restriction endonuclease McrA